MAAQSLILNFSLREALDQRVAMQTEISITLGYRATASTPLLCFKSS
jgi:hypothetical protein